MPSPFFREQSFAKGPAATGAASPLSGTKELSYAGLSAGAETGLGVSQGGQLAPQEAARAASVKASTEAAALAGKALAKTAAIGSTVGNAAIGQSAVGNAAISHAAVGNAAISHAAVGNAAMMQSMMAAAAAEPISPLVQLIMRMPGAVGMANSFFEWLTHMFMPGGHDLIGMLDPHMLHDLAGHASAIHSAASVLPAGEHFAVSLTSLPSDAPILQGLNQGGSLPSFDGIGSSTSGLPEHFIENPANIGAGPDLSNAQFEQVAPGSLDNGLAGPSTGGQAANSYLAGNQRLFSDNLGQGSQFNSITSNTSVPSTTPSMPQQAPAVQDMSQAAQSQGQMVQPQTAQTGTYDASKFGQSEMGPSAFGKQYAGDNMLASDSQVLRPSSSSYQPSGGDIKPLTAKQLTFEDIRKGVVGDHGKSLIDKIAGKLPKPNTQPQVNQAFQSRFGEPRTSAAQAPDASQSAGAPHSHSKAHDAASHTAHAQHHTTHKHSEIAQAPKHASHAHKDAQPAHSNSQSTDQSQATDQTQQAQAGDQTGDYTVHKGDSLWNIAKEKLGDGSRWSELYKLNNDVLGQNPDLIFSGTHLRVPGAENLTANAGNYIVKPGDNLWNIAKHNLGDPMKWSDIYKANTGVIGASPRLIVPGQQLAMPGAAPAAAQAPSVSPTASSSQLGPSADAGPTGQQLGMQQTVYPQMAAPTPQPSEAGIAASSDSVFRPVPGPQVDPGVGAADAATIQPIAGSDSVVSKSLAPDPSLFGQRR